MDKLVADRGILYVPDYVVNAGGVIQVADEIHGYHFDRAKPRATKIFDTTRQILRAGRRRGRAARRGGGPAGRTPHGRGGPAALDLARSRPLDRSRPLATMSRLSMSRP